MITSFSPQRPDQRVAAAAAAPEDVADAAHRARRAQVDWAAAPAADRAAVLTAIADTTAAEPAELRSALLHLGAHGGCRLRVATRCGETRSRKGSRRR
ncbi:aldehyde dehydrogenase family protein [Streptomyces shenzhenensis]|uniref:aldehyde dehydrogenase family protein n=1 Tax=Streptomyces shenzhenensis TaxID=943815 RepID=UPI000EF89CFD|nr:aldehyde dehydrogenase family protein [Streptomyces shenzhenensis]